MSFFGIDFRDQVKMLLPPIMRSVTMIDFLSALTEPLTTDAAGIKPFYDTQLIIARATSQKMVLQEVLNDLLGVSTIYIVTLSDAGYTLYVWPEGEGIVAHVFEEGNLMTTFVLSEAEATSPSAYDFIVYIPAALGTVGQDRVTELTELMKAPGLRFNTVLY